MSVKDISEQYGVSIELLSSFIQIGIFKYQEFTMRNGKYDKKTLKRVNECICLSSIGFQPKTIKNYMALQNDDVNTKIEQLRLLQIVREERLHAMHEAKRQWDCINDVLKTIR